MKRFICFFVIVALAIAQTAQNQILQKTLAKCSDLSDAGSGCSSSATSGTVTSVGFTGGLISVANSTTTPALTVAGTSGGIPYFSGAATWASSTAGTAGHLMLWGGAATAPTDGGAPTSVNYYPTMSCTVVQNATRFVRFANFNNTTCGSTEIGYLGDTTQILLAHSGTLKNLYCATNQAPASGQTIAFTVRAGTVGSGSNTGITCTVSATQHSCSDGVNTAASTAGQFASISAVTSATSGSIDVACAFENVY